MVSSTSVSIKLSFVTVKSLIQVLGSDNELDRFLGEDDLEDEVFSEIV